MATPNDIAAALQARLNRPYWSADGRRLVDENDPGNDCSGWLVVGLRAAGVEPGGFVSSSMAQWCFNAGLELDVNTGANTFGALLFWGPNRGLAGFGDSGHIAFSIGGSQMLETPSAAGRCSGLSNVQRPGMPSGAGLIPGVTYDGAPPTIHGGPIIGAPNDGMLRMGSKGPEVAELQRRLNTVAGESLGVDGDFGAQTDTALRRFQSAHGLEVDGVVGPATWGALAAGMPPVTVGPAGANPTWPGRFLVAGMVGDDVRTWQQRMSQRTPLGVDGEYGPKSRAACLAFQTAQHLEVDGVVGPQTWNATWTAP